MNKLHIDKTNWKNVTTNKLMTKTQTQYPKTMNTFKLYKAIIYPPQSSLI